MQVQIQESVAWSKEDSVAVKKWVKLSEMQLLLTRMLFQLSMGQSLPVPKLPLSESAAKMLELLDVEIAAFQEKIAITKLKLKSLEEVYDPESTEAALKFLEALQESLAQDECDRDFILETYEVSSEALKNAHEAKKLQDDIISLRLELSPFKHYLPPISQEALDKRRQSVLAKANYELYRELRRGQGFLDYRDDDIDWSSVEVKSDMEDESDLSEFLSLRVVECEEPDFLDSVEVEDDLEPVDRPAVGKMKRTVSYSESDWSKYKVTGSFSNSKPEAGKENLTTNLPPSGFKK